MNKILVPIDNTESSENAISIAHRLAENTPIQLTILHVLPTPIGMVVHEDGSLKEDSDISTTDLKNEAESLRRNLERKYEFLTNATFLVEIGDINTLIMRKLESENFDLMVLGMTGLLSKAFWSNSHTEFLTKHAKVPVLTLKCDRSKMPLDKVVLVSDFINDEVIHLDILKDIVEKFESKLILLKIVASEQELQNEDYKSRATQFAVKNDLKNFEIVFHKCKSVEEGILTFCNENNIDLIAIGTHQRGGLSTLFRKSISQNIVRDLYHPIITIPIER